MTATDPYRAAALADLTREFVSTFGEAMPVEHFATPRKEGEEWETNGRWYKREGGKTKRIANPNAAKGGGGPGKGMAQKSVAEHRAKALAEDMEVQRVGSEALEVQRELREYGISDPNNEAQVVAAMKSPKWGITARWKIGGLVSKHKNLMAQFDAHATARDSYTRKADDTEKRYGLTPGATGASAAPPPPSAPAATPPTPAASSTPPARTARIGTTPGGTRVKLNPYKPPRPLAPGDLVPAGMESAAPGSKPLPPPTPAETAKLDAHEKADGAKYGSRAGRIIRRVTEALRGLGTLGGLVSGAGLGAKIGGAVAGPLGLALGTAVGGGLGGLAGMWAGNRSGRRAGVLAARATGPANRMAEAFAEPLPPDVIQVVKARLAEMAAAAGYQLPPIPDEVVLKAVEMAQQDDAAGAVSEFRCATKKAVRKFSRLARC